MRAPPLSYFTALMGLSQGDRAWIIDLQEGAPDWMRNAHGELDTGRGDDVQPWYEGSSAGGRQGRAGDAGIDPPADAA